jgi:hypothetical protein
VVLAAEALKKVKLLGSYASYRNHLDPLNRPGGERLSLPEAEHFIGNENGVLDVIEDACNGLLSNILSEKMGEIEQPHGAIAAASKAAAASAQLSANNGACQLPSPVYQAYRAIYEVHTFQANAGAILSCTGFASWLCLLDIWCCSGL